MVILLEAIYRLNAFAIKTRIISPTEPGKYPKTDMEDEQSAKALLNRERERAMLEVSQCLMMLQSHPNRNSIIWAPIGNMSWWDRRVDQEINCATQAS